MLLSSGLSSFIQWEKITSSHQRPFDWGAAGIWFTKAGMIRHFSVMAVPRQKTLLGKNWRLQEEVHQSPPKKNKLKWWTKYRNFGKILYGGQEYCNPLIATWAASPKRRASALAIGKLLECFILAKQKLFQPHLPQPRCLEFIELQ